MIRIKTEKLDSQGIMLYTRDIVLIDDYICLITFSLLVKSGFAVYSPENDHYSDLFIYNKPYKEKRGTYKLHIRKIGMMIDQKEFIKAFENESSWNELRQDYYLPPVDREYNPTKQKEREKWK